MILKHGVAQDHIILHWVKRRQEQGQNESPSTTRVTERPGIRTSDFLWGQGPPSVIPSVNHTRKLGSLPPGLPPIPPYSILLHLWFLVLLLSFSLFHITTRKIPQTLRYLDISKPPSSNDIPLTVLQNVSLSWLFFLRCLDFLPLKVSTFLTYQKRCDFPNS